MEAQPALGLPMEKVEGTLEAGGDLHMGWPTLCVPTEHVCTEWFIWQMLH